MQHSSFRKSELFYACSQHHSIQGYNAASLKDAQNGPGPAVWKELEGVQDSFVRLATA